MPNLLCHHPIYLEKQGFYADCGHCPACRLKRRGEWAIRMEHEASSRSNHCLFVTLTYNQEHLPAYASLDPDGFTRFIKRLRIKLQRTTGERFRYFACGEYGGKTHRPHYHIIFMGLTMRSANLIYTTWGQCDSVGFKCFQTTDRKAFAYVSGYTAKKIGTNYKSRFCEQYPDKKPEFQHVSNGIGKDYFLSLPESGKKNGMIRYNKRWIVPPRYYRKLAGWTAELYTELIARKQQALIDYVVRENPKHNWFYMGSFAFWLFNIVLQKYRDECRFRIESNDKKWRDNIPILST